MQTGLEFLDAGRPSRGELRDYLLDLTRELSELSLQAGSPTASALYVLAAAELRKVKDG